MEALILAWDPERPVWSGSYAEAVLAVRASGSVRQSWSVPSVLSGDLWASPDETVEMDVWLVVVGRRPAMRGLSGHGTVTRVPGPRTDASTLQIDVDFDALLQHGDQLTLSRLVGELPDPLDEESVQVVGAASARILRRLWTEAARPERAVVEPLPGWLPPNATRRVRADRFERDPDLRRIVLAHRGSACHACGLDMEQRYGAAGRDLIQVHHITPLELLGPGYEPDPLTDLVPLCASCHVVAHSRWPEPYSTEEIKRMLRENGFLRGSILTDEQRASEAAAARILGVTARESGTP
ncbi:hypothetical protein E8P82_05105 [Arthrobacter echini]|uniref:HNH nuclease domain-containing protein n=1 Tax=Arthrobacter echini TaxID=1529066 RepID=A0A4S5E767_9MICC|nr:HNH endonuclease [Arthrobacter echini]THJ67476.1 hypothetical protein E8P82_05105 [Arthrobacter echini]